MSGGLGAFAPLLDVHGEFLEALFRHQEALVRGDLAAARAGIEALRRDLEAHIEHENSKILPAMERLGGWSRIGDPRFYRDEHDRIRRFLASFVERTCALDASAPDVHRRIAFLVADEHALRTLLEHHDERERTALYPDLLRRLPAAEVEALARPPA